MRLQQEFIAPLLYISLLYITSFAGNNNHVKAHSVTLHLHNKCPFPIWPATAPNTGFPVIAEGGFYLPPGQTHHVIAPWKWTGRIWARTKCSFTGGPRACLTGDCNGQLHCNGLTGAPPVTLVQISVQADQSQLSFYDVSVVDGYNLPVSVSARSGAGKCNIGGCTENVNTVCPTELRVMSGDEVVACKSACLAFGADAFCCRNEFESPEKCGPNLYSKVFKRACPSYYSYAFDSPAPLASCAAKEYVITFCPSAWGRGNSTMVSFDVAR